MHITNMEGLRHISGSLVLILCTRNYLYVFFLLI